MLSARHRVTRAVEYRTIVRRGRTTREAPLVLHALQAENEPARFGFIVSKAVGNAVQRNLVRRRLKDISHRQLVAGLNGWHIVFRASPGAADAPFISLKIAADTAVARLTQTAKHGGRSA